MPSSRSVFISTVLFLLLSLITTSAYSQYREKINIDRFLKNVDLIKFIGKNHPANLGAQMRDPNASTRNVDELENFLAIGVLYPENNTVMTEFGIDQQIINTKTFDSPLLGVMEFSQKEIPMISLQQGLESLRTCMANQGVGVPEKITRLFIYKTVNTSDIVYDYVFKYGPHACQEVLYTPAKGMHPEQCQMGMAVNCHFEMTGRKKA